MNEKIIVLRINGVDYKVKTTISMGLLRIISSEEDGEKEFVERVAEAILCAIQLENIENKPSVEKVLEVGDRVFQQYINAVISSNEKYNNYYGKRPETEPLCERFCKALDDYTRESMAEFSKKAATVVAQTYQPLTEMLNSIGEMVAKACEPALAISKQFADVVQRISQITASINQSIAPVLESIAKMQESTLRDLRKAAKSWNEIDWNALEVSYRKWGEYGWTLIGQAPLSFFAKQPENQINADKQALQYFKKNGLKLFFYDLQKLQVNKKDLESAMFCFNNKQYKACAMLLCAMIEAPLIKIQPAEQQRRKVGRGAVKRFKDETLGTVSLENSRFLYLHTANVLSFLNMLFDDANDFRLEPKHLNRNFIGHGMEKRDVRRKDCVKLFLGLHNTMEMLELQE